MLPYFSRCFRRNTLLFLLFVFGTGYCFAQEHSPISSSSPDVQQLLEDAAEITEIESVDDILTLPFTDHPLHLNNTNKEELESLHLLSNLQITKLLMHIEKNGYLMTIYELQAIEGFDLSTIEKLLPYVTVTDHLQNSSFHIKELSKDGQHTLLLRYGQILETQTGFKPIDSATLYKKPNSRYLGGPQKIYIRYRFAYAKKVSIGITADKDQGEPFLKKRKQFACNNCFVLPVNKKQPPGFDFYSAHLFIRDIKNILTLALGDYKISFGQGLAAWSGFSIGKSTEILYTKKTAGVIQPYTASDENRFMRGIATTLKYKHISFTPFYSRKKADAHMNDTLENGTPATISSIQQTGIHSTPSEITGKHIVTQTIYGGHVSYLTKKSTLGITLVRDLLNLQLNPRLTAYNQFAKGNNDQLNISADYQFTLKNAHFFGETAFCKNGGTASLNGLLIQLDPRLSFTVLHRYYTRNYQSNLSAAFGESGSSNEKGLYMGISMNLLRSLTWNACYDRFEFLWLRYRVDAPSNGHDLHTQIRYSPSKKWDMLVRMRFRHKEKNTNEQAPSHYLVEQKSENYRFHVSCSLSNAFKLQNRVEFTRYDQEFQHHTGYLIYQDMVYNRPGKSFSCSLRFALFQTDGFDSRLYEYENDIPGSYSIPSFYDRGSRFYVLLNYSINKHLEYWIRFSQTYYDNKEVISEGTLSEISGKTKSEIKMQMRLQF
jgi:hypothetical protein